MEGVSDHEWDIRSVIRSSLLWPAGYENRSTNETSWQLSWFFLKKGGGRVVVLCVYSKTTVDR